MRRSNACCRSVGYGGSPQACARSPEAKKARYLEQGDRYSQVRPGVLVLVRYTGLQTSSAGRIFERFEVFVAEHAGWAEQITSIPLPFPVEKEA